MVKVSSVNKSMEQEVKQRGMGTPILVRVNNEVDEMWGRRKEVKALL